jgi:hypothetical protein
MRHDDGDWGGYSYEWNDAQTDAVLLPSGKTKTVGAQTWTFPSRVECLRCHTLGAGRTLGLEVAQLNRDYTYPGEELPTNELARLEHIGIFASPLGADPSALPAYPAPFGDAPLSDRARSYLHANCAQCHRPSGGAGRATMDLRYSTPFAGTQTCLAVPHVDDLGIPDGRILQPGVPDRSILSLRVHATDVKRMPPLGRATVDPKGSALLDDWIRSISTCP